MVKGCLFAVSCIGAALTVRCSLSGEIILSYFLIFWERQVQRARQSQPERCQNKQADNPNVKMVASRKYSFVIISFSFNQLKKKIKSNPTQIDDNIIYLNLKKKK